MIVRNCTKTIAFILIQVAKHIQSWVLRQSDFKKLEKKKAEKSKTKDKQAPAVDEPDKEEDAATSEDEPEGSLGSLSEPDSDTIISIHDSADEDDA